jgi:GntR family transcriptional regulator/MocR family aminotransferase
VRQLLAGRGARLEVVGGKPVETAARIACTGFDGAARVWLPDWARDRDGWIVEDDRDAELWGDEAPPPPLAAEEGARALLVGSFNRVLFPGLCVSYLVAPPALIEPLREAHAIAGGRASLASQLALEAFISEGHFARHVRRRRQAYVERRAALIEALGGIVDPAHAGRGLCLGLEIGRARSLAARLAAERLGGAAASDTRLLLGLGSTPETIRAEGPRLAAAILSELSQGHV